MPTINKKHNTVKPIKWNENHSQDYYGSKYWKALRKAYKQSHPLCEECLANGIARPSEHIHHIKPFLMGKTDDERWKLLLDPNNLQALCIDCHHKKHKKEFGNKTYDL